MGSIYKRGTVYWIQYYRNGKPYRESTKSKKEADAKRLLKRCEGEISEGKLPGIYFDKVRFDDLPELLYGDYRRNHRKSLVRAKRSVGHLKRYFEGYKLIRQESMLISRAVWLRVLPMPQLTENWQL